MFSFSTSDQKLPSLGAALLPIGFLVLCLAATVYVFGSDSTSGPVQIVLILSTAVAALVAYRCGISWTQVEEGIRQSIGTSLSAILILLLIGSLAGTWMLSGIVPTIIYYGLQIVDPTTFLFAACFASAVISVATGSSWSTIATVGVALLAIGQALGISKGIVAGAIISGAYFGDKVSPLSDTTNLASAVAGTPLFIHIRYMLYTTIPSILITLLIFFFIGWSSEISSDTHSEIPLILEKLDSTFLISPWLMVVPTLVILMIGYQVAAAPALLAGTLLGATAALIAQPELVAKVGGLSEESFSLLHLFKGTIQSLYTTVSVHTGHPMTDELLETGGMAGMLNTVWLILCAISFGGTMEAAGFLKRITAEIVKKARRRWSLISSTSATCLFFNTTAADQYLSIIIPGKMFEKVYKERNLKPEVLSRTLEDSATVTSVLIPWNTCGATQASVLGVATLAYAPFCFFNIISPLMTVLFAVLGIHIRYKAPNSTQEQSKESTSTTTARD